MDDFRQYERMRDLNFTPKQVYLAGKSDGLDEITLFRLIRKVFALSLADAKRAIGAGDRLEAKQEVAEGSKVYWDGRDPSGTLYLIEATVTSIVGSMAHVQIDSKYGILDGDLVEMPLDGPRSRQLKVSYLERPLAERLEKSAIFLQELARADSQ